jgi:hypothetical protein
MREWSVDCADPCVRLLVRLLFAYDAGMAAASSGMLRREISARNLARAEEHLHELTYGAVPSVIYQDDAGAHGNFCAASYRAICARPEWSKRLTKSYTASKRVPRAADRRRSELDCANSSDALLMNVFCYPGILRRVDVCSLLGVESGATPEFGVRARVPLVGERVDRTEIDMRLGDLLVEAKLTETGFQTAPLRLVERYRDLGEVFDLRELRRVGEKVRGYQLIRGALAAHSLGGSFAVLCDGRRADLVEEWFGVMRAVRSFSFRSRLKLLTWQELAAVVPPGLRRFLNEKYGVVAS